MLFSSSCHRYKLSINVCIIQHSYEFEYPQMKEVSGRIKSVSYKDVNDIN